SLPGLSSAAGGASELLELDPDAAESPTDYHPPPFANPSPYQLELKEEMKTKEAADAKALQSLRFVTIANPRQLGEGGGRKSKEKRKTNGEKRTGLHAGGWQR